MFSVFELVLAPSDLLVCGLLSLEEREPDHHEEPRSILIENTWSPSTDPFFREDELQEVHQVLTEFFSESHAPSYIINSEQDIDVDPRDGAIAGPSGMCKKKLQNDAGGSTSSKIQTEQRDCQVLHQMSYESEEENASSNVCLFYLSSNFVKHVHNKIFSA